MTSSCQQNDVTYQLQSNTRSGSLISSALLVQTVLRDPSPMTPAARPKSLRTCRGLLHAYKTIFSEGLLIWMPAFSIQIPLKTEPSTRRLAQTQISKRQLIMNRTKTEQNIIVQVRNSVELSKPIASAWTPPKFSRN